MDTKRGVAALGAAIGLLSSGAAVAYLIKEATYGTSSPPPTDITPPRTSPSSTGPGVSTGSRGPGPPVLEPQWADLQSYKRRCEQLDLKGARARVLYEAKTDMRRGDSETVTAAVTLNQSAPPEKVLHRPRATEELGVVVSCQIEARLSSSPYQFDVNPTGWVTRSLLTTDTARWTWYATPKIGGTHTLVLSLRPIVRVQQPASTTPISVSAQSDVQQYETEVHVNVPWNERPQETMTRLAATFGVAQTLIEAMTAFVVALVALGTALGIRRHRRKRAAV
jgi:hypothetical protein